MTRSSDFRDEDEIGSSKEQGLEILQDFSLQALEFYCCQLHKMGNKEIDQLVFFGCFRALSMIYFVSQDLFEPTTENHKTWWL